MNRPELLSIHDESARWRAELEADEARLEMALSARHPAISVYVCDRQPAPEYPLLPRGVYVARYLTATGCQILNCIDRRGRHVAQVVVRRLERWDDYIARAGEVLDELDPGLRLV